MTAATTIVRQPALASSPQPTSNGASANRSMYEGSQTPTPAEERVTAVCGMEVRAAATGERREPSNPNDSGVATPVETTPCEAITRSLSRYIRKLGRAPNFFTTGSTQSKRASAIECGALLRA